jgi:hypothetical protein
MLTPQNRFPQFASLYLQHSIKTSSAMVNDEM